MSGMTAECNQKAEYEFLVRIDVPPKKKNGPKVEGLTEHG
jgi:hypothetical protein